MGVDQMATACPLSAETPPFPLYKISGTSSDIVKAILTPLCIAWAVWQPLVCICHRTLLPTSSGNSFILRLIPSNKL
jgi:hypothetical protein